jgi:hypothetical protein
MHLRLELYIIGAILFLRRSTFVSKQLSSALFSVSPTPVVVFLALVYDASCLDFSLAEELGPFDGWHLAFLPVIIVLVVL